MRSKATGKDEQIARLHATYVGVWRSHAEQTRKTETLTTSTMMLDTLPRYEDLSDQLAELETLCNSSSDTNLETLDKLFRSIPRHEQLLASGD